MTSQTDTLRRTVRGEMGPAEPCVSVHSTVGPMIEAMCGQKATACLVVDEDGRLVGIVTEQDVVRRMALKLSRDDAVASIMTSPVVTVDANDPLYRAVAVMKRRRVRHLPVVDGDGRPEGLIVLDKALAAMVGTSLLVGEKSSHEETVEGWREAKRDQTNLATALLDDGVPAPEIQSLLSEMNADLHQRVLNSLVTGLEAAGWGPPPVAYSLIVMGSAGRKESFLAPDQDNGLILADYPETEHNRIDAYFSELSIRLARRLDEVGFPLCKGNVMASNPVWRKSLSEWRSQFNMWVRRRRDIMLLHSDVLFDFRHVGGAPDLAVALRRHIGEVVPRQNAYLREIYRIQSDHGVALGWFGRLSGERDEQDRPGVINLKMRGTLPLVEGVRLLALKAGIDETPTLARLAALRQRDLIDAEEYDGLAAAYGLITQLLFRGQIRAVREGREADDYALIAHFSRRERESLVSAFRAIEGLRKRLQLDFGEG